MCSPKKHSRDEPPPVARTLPPLHHEACSPLAAAISSKTLRTAAAEARLPAPSRAICCASVRKALGSLTVESKLEELVKQRKSDAAMDPKDANGKAINLKAGDVEHPTKEDKDKGKGIVDFRRRIAMLRLLPLKAIITTKRVLRAQHDQLRATARAHSHSPSLARLPRPTHAPR